MRTAHSAALRLLFVSAALAAGLQAQVAFVYRTSTNPAPVAVDNNGSIVFPGAAVGSSSTVNLIATNTTPAATLTLSGATASGGPFQASTGTVTIGPGGTATINLTFTPTSSQPAAGTLQLQFTSGTGTLNYGFFLSGNGQSAGLIPSYALADGNQVAIANGGTIAFPQTAVNGTATATFSVVNNGNGAGTVNSVSLTGSQFKLAGLPLLPATIQPNGSLRFNIVFAPATAGDATGTLRVDLNGQPLAISLAGSGASAALVYEFVTDSAVTPITGGATVHMPDTALGSTSSAIVRVRNTGNLDTKIGTITVVGSAFKLANVPPVPATIPAGGTLAFNLQFTPADASGANGTVLIDSFSIPVTGTGVGSKLDLFTRVGSTVTPITTGGGITFPNTTVGSNNTVYVRMTNSGNAPATVNGISVSAPVFALGGLPALPVTIPPGQTQEFSIDFKPAALGTVNGNLQIDSLIVPLRGIGGNPPALPQVQFTSVGDTANPLDQPSVGLALAQPYGIDLAGALNLAFTPDSFSDDPNIQFATGGRSVNFRVPANTTQAIFGDSAQSVQFQAGTVAGTIRISPTFTAGNADMTPNPAPSKTVVVSGGPPQLRNVQVGTRTATSFEILITGLSTTRSVTQLNFTFAPAQGAALQTTFLPVNVEAPFTAWYQSPNAKPFGSQFTSSVTINVAGDANTVQSATVTAVNAQGSSAPMTVNLR